MTDADNDTDAVALAGEIESQYRARGLTEYPPDRVLAKFILDQEAARIEAHTERGVEVARKIVEEKQTCSMDVERMARALLHRDQQVKASEGGGQ